MSTQAIFLFDMNAFRDAEIYSDESLQKAVSCLRVVCLRLLVEFYKRSKNFRFGVKFFNQGSFNRDRDKPTLHEVCLETYENLENKISDQYSRYLSYYKKLSQAKLSQHKQESKDSNTNKSLPDPPIKNLNTALKEVLCYYEWNAPEICSPVRNNKYFNVENVNKNYVVLFSSCPSDLSNFFGVDSILSPTHIYNLLMPDALYKKFVVEAGINLIWLDTSGISSDFTISEHVIEARQAIESAMKTSCGALIPIQVLSQVDCIPCNNKLDDTGEINMEFQGNNVDISVFPTTRSLPLPFSLLFSHYISSSHTKQVSVAWDCTLILPNESLDLRLELTSADSKSHLQTSVHRSSSVKRKRSGCAVQKEPQESVCPKWCKFAAVGAVTRDFYGVPNSTYFCHPSNCNVLANDSLVFARVIQMLCCQNQYLVLKCETEDGDTSLGLLCSFANLSAVIAIYNPVSSLLHKKNDTTTRKMKQNVLIALEDFLEEKVESLMENVDNKINDQFNSTECTSHSKSFQMACMESWFVPSSRISEITKGMKIKTLAEEYACFGGTLKRLQREYREERKRKCQESTAMSPVRRSPRLKRLRSNLSPVSNSSMLITEDSTFNAITADGSFSLSESDIKDKDKMLTHLRKAYDLALSHSGSLSVARSIVNLVVMFLKSERTNVVKDDVLHFMKENILTTAKKIAELYEGKADAESIAKRTKEYQIQVLLNLELEAAFPSDCSVKCVGMVIDLLRGMLFVVGHTTVTHFLQDYIKEKYSHNLHHILLDIEEELDVSIVEGSNSSSPVISKSPDSPTRSSTWSFSSVPSCRSSSSISSQKDVGSKKVPNQSAFFTNFHNKQIMVPGELLRKAKKQKAKAVPVAAIKRSPRIALQKKEPYGSVSPKPRKVRRNLFKVDMKTQRNKDRKLPPACSPKKRQLTPKGHHVLKTTFVPETPSPKQGRSSIRSRQDKLRRICGTDTEVLEIAESPNPSSCEGSNC